MSIRQAFLPPFIPRTNRPIVSGDYNLAESDLGVVMSSQNSTCHLPAYSVAQDGREYGVKNDSGALISIQPASGESFRVSGQQVSSVTVPPDEARQLARVSTSHAWIIV